MSSATLPFDRLHLTPGTRLAVAVSGGADSVALLRILHAANTLPRESLGIGLFAIHVHHGIRGEAADRDQKFVQELCDRLAVPLTLRAVDTPAHAAAHHETLEEAARNLRYAAFTDLLASRAVDAIATAHTLDDQAETVLMKFLRGAWTEGLGGIAPVFEVKLPATPHSASDSAATIHPRSARVLRPLLNTSRAEVEQYLRSLDQPWMTDETNLDPAHTRNRVRKELLPALRAFNPALDATLGNLAEIARGEEAHWQAELDRLIPLLLLPGKPVRGGGRAVSTSASAANTSLSLELERLRPLSAATRRRVLRAAARRLGARLGFPETERLAALCGFSSDALAARSYPDRRAGSILELSGGLRAERSARELRLVRTTVQPR